MAVNHRNRSLSRHRNTEWKGVEAHQSLCRWHVIWKPVLRDFQAQPGHPRLAGTHSIGWGTAETMIARLRTLSRRTLRTVPSLRPCPQERQSQQVTSCATSGSPICFRGSLAAVDKGNGYFGHTGSVTTQLPEALFEKSKARGLNAASRKSSHMVHPVAAEGARAIGSRQPQGPSREAVDQSADHAAVPRPMVNRTAWAIAGPNHDVAARFCQRPGHQRRQMVRSMAAIGVHGDQPVVLMKDGPAHRLSMSTPQAQLGGPP